MAQPPKDRQDVPSSSEKVGRRGRVAAIGSDAGRTAEAAFVRAGFADPALVLHWETIAGPELARIARPVKLKDGTLTLLAEPAAALFLGHESRTLISRVNQWAGRAAVARIKFIQGRLEHRPPPPPQPKPAAAPEPSDPALGFEGPDALKSALQSLARWRAPGEDQLPSKKETP